MAQDKIYKIKIKDQQYSMVSDDLYLNAMGPVWEPHLVALFCSLIKKDNVVFDVGANVGCVSILFSGLAEKVYSFEPSPTTFKYLSKNIENAGLRNVTAYNFGLGSKEGESTITYSPESRSGAFVSNRLKNIGHNHVTEVIKIKTIDDMIREQKISKIDVIKMDVEGFEKEVITGARNTLNTFKPVTVLELNHFCLNALQRISVPDFFDFLKSVFPILLAVQGNTFANIYDDSDAYEVLYYNINNNRYSNIVAAFQQEQLTEFHSRFQHFSTAPQQPATVKSMIRKSLVAAYRMAKKYLG
jgi:FkbM family methyltransferase